jgi:hypothetical protein
MYLSHCKFNYIFVFASSFDILYLFKFLVLIFDQEEGTHDNPHCFEGLKNAIKRIQPFAPLDG